MKSNTLLVGCAEADITPEIGMLMACFPEPGKKVRHSRGVHDPLRAKAIAISDDRENVCLCSCDIPVIREIDVKKIRAEVEKEIPELSGARIIIAATHTHSSIDTVYLFGNTPDDSCIEEMNSRIAKAAVQAYRNRVPASMSVGKSELDLTFNRRVSDRGGNDRCVWEYEEGEPAGSRDPELIVVKFDRKNEKIPIAILVNYTAHALTVGPGNLLFSADYPGTACAFVEKTFQEAMALFFNGAAGNVHPRKCMRKDFAVMEEFGRKLGEEIIRISKQTKPVENHSINFHCVALDFANRVDSSQRVKAEISCLALGPVIIGFIPGELFVEFQLDYKKKIKPHTGIIIGYANGWPGYIPTIKDYDIGGYGVDLCKTDPPELSRTALPNGAGEEIMERLFSLAYNLGEGIKGKY